MGAGARKASPLGVFYCVKKGLRVSVAAHPQGPLAHRTLFLVGSDCSLAISLGGEGVKMGAHLWLEGSTGQRARVPPTCSPSLFAHPLLPS